MSDRKAYNAYYTQDEKGVYSSSNSVKTDSKHGVGVIQPLPFKQVQYFEVTLVKTSTTNPVMAIGFAPPPPEWKKLGHVGWYDGTVGYHADTGCLYDDITNSTFDLEKFENGDIVGGFWNVNTNEVFFTKNGKKLEKWITFRSTKVCGMMIPTITFDYNAALSFSVNGGESNFAYDLSKETMNEDTKEVKEITTRDQKEIAIDLGMFVNKKDGSDVVIKSSDNKTLSGHKLILSARSSYLADLLKTSSTLELKFDHDTILKVLEYIYSGKTLLTLANWENVLRLADKLALASLRRVCFEFIVKTLNKHTVLDVMIKAQSKSFEFDATDLLERCVVFVEKKAYEIIKTDSFLKLSEDVIIMMLKNTNTCADEFDLFQACVRWAEQRKKEGDKREVSEILKNIGKWIRYPQLNAIELVKRVKPTGVCEYPLYKEALEYIAKPDATDSKTLLKLEFQSRYKQFSGSNLLDNKTSWLLKRWLPYSKKGWEIIYRASKDGFGAATFHSKCDNQGPTVTIIQSEAGNVFGGYNPTHWSQSGSYSFDQNSFIFVLQSKKGKPSKFDNFGTDRNSTYNCAGYGPTWGGGHDLYVCDNSNTNTSSYCNSSYSFKIPGEVYGSTTAQSVLAGSYNYKTKEIEVFRKVKE
jgi:hypothetical protein